MSETDFENHQPPERPSKSRLKRESHALQEIGEQLVELPEAKLSLIPMPESLQQAVELARRIQKRSGRKRQIKFIGKLLRSIDATPILEALQNIETRSAKAAARHHLAERWRERLLEEGDVAIGAFLDEYPQVDRQQLRQLVRNAQSERRAEKPPRRSRGLFRLVREVIGTTTD